MLNDYVTWVRGVALPVWAERGFDAAAGRFRERLDGAGAPVAVPHRAMVQARQIFVFAHAAEQGWLAEGAALAERAMAGLLRDFACEEGDATSCHFSIDPAGGGAVSELRDAYAHAFVLFSLAALYRLNGDPALLETADRIICFVERSLADPVHGGLFDALPRPAEKRQNPHMHLLEAYLFLAQAAPERDYLARAGQLVALFRRHFLQDGLLLEYFRPDWSVPPGRDRWEPGHHFEWVWLLDAYGSLSGEDTAAAQAVLYESATAHGLAANGLLVDELSSALAVTKGSHRLWPHTEAIKAAATRHAAGDADARGFADAMAGGLMGRFLDRPFAGGWTDQLDADGAALVDYVPASSLYHLVLAASVAAKGFAAPAAAAKALGQ